MSALKVRHQFPGRVRFCVPELKLHREMGDWLKRSLFALQGILDVRVNAFAGSVVVYYDEQILSADVLSARLAAIDFHCGESSDLEHEFTRGDIALNVIGTLTTLFLPAHWGAIPTTLLVAPSMVEGISELKQGKMSVEVLDAIALGLSAWRGDYRTAMMTQSLISLGEYMEQKTTRNSDQLLADLLRPQDVKVWRIIDGSREPCLSSQLVAGDVIELAPGDVIPIDGRIVYGTALVNQSALTGEGVPLRREEGAVVYAGTTVHDGNIRVIVDKVGSEATTAKIAALIYDSLSEKSHVQQATQAMADRRVKITLAIGAAVFALTQDLNRVASVFLVDYSCALKLSTPVTFKSIMYRAAQEGVLLKGGSAIERLGQVDTCVFDKTGTLTHGDMEVTDVVSFCDENSPQDLLAIAASVEEHSNHPLSQAVVNAAKNHALPHIDHGEVEYVIAHGLRSTLHDANLIMGSRHFLETHEGVNFACHEDKIRELEARGRHVIFISHEGRLIGVIGLRDHLREETHRTLMQLRELGIQQLVMISGDSYFKANQLGEELGLDRVYAEATPKSKSQIVADLQRKGHQVMFIGDGVNDAPALSQAHVGVAMCDGTELARQAADVVLLRDNLHGVVLAVQLGQIAMTLVEQNIKAAEYINSVIMFAAAMGWLTPTVSALLHNGTTLAILARSAAVKNAS